MSQISLFLEKQFPNLYELPTFLPILYNFDKISLPPPNTPSVDVHRIISNSEMLVKNIPGLENRKLHWYLSSRDDVEEKYRIKETKELEDFNSKWKAIFKRGVGVGIVGEGIGGALIVNGVVNEKISVTTKIMQIIGGVTICVLTPFGVDRWLLQDTVLSHKIEWDKEVERWSSVRAKRLEQRNRQIKGYIETERKHGNNREFINQLETAHAHFEKIIKARIDENLVGDV